MSFEASVPGKPHTETLVAPKLAVQKNRFQVLKKKPDVYLIMLVLLTKYFSVLGSSDHDSSLPAASFRRGVEEKKKIEILQVK